MKNLKKLVTTLTLTGIIIIGVTNANAGMLMSDLTSRDSQPQTCTENIEKTDITEKVDNGIVVSSIGIIISSIGIIISSLTKSDTQTDCGFILTD